MQSRKGVKILSKFLTSRLSLSWPRIRLWLLLPLAFGFLAACTTPALKTTTTVPLSAERLQHYRQALADLAAGSYSAAEKVLDQLIRVRPELAGLHFNRGLLYARTKRPEKALSEQQQAIKLKPRLAPAYNQIGILKRQSGQFDAAEKAYRNALRIDENYANAELNLGILLDLYRQQPAQALEHYQRFQALQQEADASVHQWITNLTQRLQKKPQNMQESP